MKRDYLVYIEDMLDAMEKAEIAVREQYPSIPWKEMAGMRDRIIHGYDNVNLEIVWQVVHKDIPQVKPQLQQILADYGASWPPEPEDGE